jgi:hypothetical protein
MRAILTLAFLLLVGAATTPSSFAGAGFSGPRLTHTMCPARTGGTLPVCNVTVYAASNPVNGGCIVKVDDVVVLAEPLQVVAWNLSVVGSGTFRFAAPSTSPIRTAIAIDDDALPVFAVDGVDGTTQVRRRSVRAILNAFTYTVNLDQLVSGAWVNCAPLDPIMVNRGN